MEGLNSSEMTPAMLAKPENLWEPVKWDDYLSILVIFAIFLAITVLALMFELMREYACTANARPQGRKGG